ncbi:hypothetical protein NUACC21_72730 [Scytonema sp. NUACC21]
MLSNTTNQLSAATYVGVPSSGSIPNPQGQPLSLTPYDYFALLPALITAATPLILGLREKKSSVSGTAEGKDND